MATSSARPPHLYDREVAIAPERETLSRALEQSEERFHRLAQRIAAGVFRVSTEGLIIEVNPAMVRMLGYESEAAFNRAFKRSFGVPPATWRKSTSAPRAAPAPVTPAS